MVAFLTQLLVIRAWFARRARLEVENLLLRQQLIVLRRQHPKRVRLLPIDRLLLVWLYRLYPSLLDAIIVVQPEPVIRWHRRGLDIHAAAVPKTPTRESRSSEARKAYSRALSPAPQARFWMLLDREAGQCSQIVQRAQDAAVRGRSDYNLVHLACFGVQHIRGSAHSPQD
jgi:hypothetical protein